MAENKEYFEFLYAYSFGCLDNEDLTKLKSYLASEETFPWQELGEFQNLSSLLPSILSIETPAPEVKDTVARKLYRIKSEIKAKRAKLNQSRPPQQIAPSAINEKDEDEVEKIETKKEEKNESGSGDFEVVTPLRKSEDIFKTISEIPGDENSEPGSKTTAEDEIDTLSDIDEEEQPKKKSSYLEKKYSQDAAKKEKRNSRFMTILILLIVVVGIVIAYLKVTGDVKKYEIKINSLNQQVNSLTEQFNRNKELQSVLASRDLKTINLDAAGKTKEVFGKLFISPENSKGFVQVSNMPALTGNNVYQLWINIKGKYYSLTKISSVDNFSYVSFELPNIEDMRKVSFELTAEPAGGSDQPGENLFLKGSF